MGHVGNVCLIAFLNPARLFSRLPRPASAYLHLVHICLLNMHTKVMGAMDAPMQCREGVCGCMMGLLCTAPISHPWQMPKVQMGVARGAKGGLATPCAHRSPSAHPRWVQQGCMGTGLVQLSVLPCRWVKTLFSECFPHHCTYDALSHHSNHQK